MRVLLTGAFGNVGGETIRELLAAGHDVRVFDLPSKRNAKAAAQFASKIEVVWGDLRNPHDIEKAVVGREAVIHDAAIIPPASEKYPELTRDVNIGGMQHVIAACEAQSSRPRLILASSVSVFGPCQDRPPPRCVGEPLVPTDHYTRSKVRCEAMLRESSLDWVILRFGGVIPLVLEASEGVDFEDFFGTSPESRLEYVHPADVGLAQTRALDCDEALGKVLLIGGGEGSQILMRDLKSALLEAVGVGRLPDSWFGDSPYYTDWMDTGESQRLLRYQRHDFASYRQGLYDRMRWTRLAVRPLRWPIRRFLAHKSRAVVPLRPG